MYPCTCRSPLLCHTADEYLQYIYIRGMFNKFESFKDTGLNENNQINFVMFI